MQIVRGNSITYRVGMIEATRILEYGLSSQKLGAA